MIMNHSKIQQGRGNSQPPLFLPPYKSSPKQDWMLVIDGDYNNKQAWNSGASSIISFCLSQNIKLVGQICWSDWKLTQKKTQQKNLGFF